MMAHGKTESRLTCAGQAAHLGADYSVTSIDIKIPNAYTLSTSLKNAYLFFKEIDNAGQKEKTPHFL